MSDSLTYGLSLKCGRADAHLPPHGGASPYTHSPFMQTFSIDPIFFRKTSDVALGLPPFALKSSRADPDGVSSGALMHEPEQFPQYGAMKHHHNLLMCRDEIGVLPGFGRETGEVGCKSRCM